MNELASLSNAAMSIAVTYLLHSTVLLALCWLATRFTHIRSHFLVERLWKLAAVLGMITAALQHSGVTGIGLSLYETAAVVDCDERFDRADRRETVESRVDELSMDDNVFARQGDTTPSSELQQITQSEISRAGDGQPNDEGRPILDPSLADARSSQQQRSALGRAPLESTDPAGERRRLVDASLPSWFQGEWLQPVPPWISIAAASLLISCIGVGGALLIVQSLTLRVRLSQASTLETGPAREALDHLLRSSRIRRRIWLLASARHDEPMAYGLLRWTIVLPEHLEERLGEKELQALLAHEIAHLIRGDVRWLWIGRVLCSCLAFQPLNFLARREWQQAAEYLCDDWAVERGIRSLALAKCLVQIAEWRCGAEPCSVGLAATGSKATIVRRVERLVDDQRRADVWAKPPRRRLLTLGAAIIVVCFAGFAPRVAVPRLADNERECVESAAAVSPADETAARDWHALEEEMLQLETDLSRAAELLQSTPQRESTALADDLGRRAARLASRRERITLLLKMESDK